MTLNTDLQDTALHTVAYKFQSERGMHERPPAPTGPEWVFPFHAVVDT